MAAHLGLIGADVAKLLSSELISVLNTAWGVKVVTAALDKKTSKVLTIAPVT